MRVCLRVDSLALSFFIFTAERLEASAPSGAQKSRQVAGETAGNSDQLQDQDR